MLLSDAPFFTAPPPPGSDGVDFLGLRALNLNLIGQAIPGINNVVRWIRPFSVIAWIVWRYETDVSSGRRAAASKEDFQAFAEKVESLYVWSHQLAGVTTGIPGIGQALPKTDTAVLSFAAFGQRTSLTSLFAGGTYGPAAKAPFGLGFIATIVETGLYAVTPAGRKLAVAFDAHLRFTLTPHCYQILADPEVLEASRPDAAAIFPAWRFDAPTSTEVEAFLAQLYQPHLSGASRNETSVQVGADQRAAFIALVRSTLREMEAGITLDSLRRKLCTMPPPLTHEDAVPPEALCEARSIWQVLQVRQAQRLALEALFAFLENLLWNGTATSSQAAVQLIAASVQTAKSGKADAAIPFPFNGHTDLSGFFELALVHFEKLAANADGLYATMVADNAFDLFRAMDKLQESAAGGKAADDLCPRAFVLLAATAVFAEHFAKEELTKDLAAEGRASRLPLSHWARFVTVNRQVPFSRFATKVLETYVISQHFAVAAARFREEKSRLRFTIDDAGLTTLLRKPSDILAPFPSRDRLQTLLWLCCESGLIHSRVEGNETFYCVKS